MTEKKIKAPNVIDVIRLGTRYSFRYSPQSRILKLCVSD
jgi:hypothetical protein